MTPEDEQELIKAIRTIKARVDVLWTVSVGSIAASTQKLPKPERRFENIADKITEVTEKSRFTYQQLGKVDEQTLAEDFDIAMKEYLAEVAGLLASDKK